MRFQYSTIKCDLFRIRGNKTLEIIFRVIFICLNWCYRFGPLSLPGGGAAMCMELEGPLHRGKKAVWPLGTTAPGSVLTRCQGQVWGRLEVTAAPWEGHPLGWLSVFHHQSHRAQRSCTLEPITNSSPTPVLPGWRGHGGQVAPWLVHSFPVYMCVFSRVSEFFHHFTSSDVSNIFRLNISRLDIFLALVAQTKAMRSRKYKHSQNVY